MLSAMQESDPLRDAQDSAREAAVRLIWALEEGDPAVVSDAAEAAYLVVGRLAALARAATRRQ